MSTVNRSQMALRDFAMRYPEAHEDFPWGERVIYRAIAPKKLVAALPPGASTAARRAPARKTKRI